MIRKYPHELNTEVQSIAGWYELDKEEKINHNGKDYLYLVGTGEIDSSCCGEMGCHFAVVPGSIVSWKSDTNEEGVTTSEIEIVSDEKIRDELRKVLLEKEKMINQVNFW